MVRANTVHPDLVAVARAVKVVDEGRFIVAGSGSSTESVRRSALSNAAEQALDPDAAPPPKPSMESALANVIYERCYIRPAGPESRVLDEEANRDFQLLLSRTNPDATVWEPGWHLEPGGTDGWVTVIRYGVRFEARIDEVRGAASAALERTPCIVRVPTRYQRLLPGFYLIVGSAERTTRLDEDEGDDETIVRLYWHLRSHVACAWLAELSRVFDAAKLPFRAKVLASPTAYRRADAGVLYMARTDFPRARPLLVEIHSQLEPGLRDGVPLFTKRLAPGLAIAEDPGTGRSFGEDRCGLIAQALLTAFREGKLDTGSKLAAIEATFRSRGLDPRRPHIGAGSRDAYSLRPSMRTLQSNRPAETGQRSAVGTGHHVATRHRQPRASATVLSAAIAIGNSLSATAYWDRARRRCNWIGRSNNGTLLPAGTVMPRTDALSWDLYGGLSGVALFLAALFTQTGDDVFRRTALGAIRCANEQLGHELTAHQPTPLSFYGGITGLAYATWRVGEQTEEQTPTSMLFEALSMASSSLAMDTEAEDFLGYASAIGALTSLARWAKSPQCREQALTIGRKLCRSELIARYAAPADAAGEPPLTGLSHGAAGIGLSLLALHADTGEDGFLNAALQAIAYEDRLFDAASGNWPDLRRPPPGEPDVRPRFAVAWCHGAPGIALSRLRAIQLDSRRRSLYAEHAEAALETTRCQLQRVRTVERSDPTPCHGTTGLIEALLTAGLVLHDHSYEALAREAAVELAGGIVSGAELRSGTLCGGPNPSLMLGAAGVGYHLLRVHNPEAVPSLLTAV